VTNLEDLYREIILDHYRSPRNRGELESPPAHRVEGFNPLCGDEVVVTMIVDDGELRDIKFAGSGCSISQSSASLMSSAVKGRTVGEVRQLIRSFKSMMSVHEASLAPDEDGAGSPGAAANGAGAHVGGAGGAGGGPALDVRQVGELAALQGVVKFPVRIKCATLSWNALAQGLDEVNAGA
jgi:nitrogen fixation NifU-like protein